MDSPSWGLIPNGMQENRDSLLDFIANWNQMDKIFAGFCTTKFGSTFFYNGLHSFELKLKI